MQVNSTLDLTQEKPSSRLLWERKGLLGWWLNLTAPPRPVDVSSLQAREYVRRSELVSLTGLALICFVLSITSASIKDPHVLQDVLTLPVVFSIALILNRFGKITIAAYILICGLIVGAVVPSLELINGFTLDWFPTLDVMSVAVFLSALIIHRRAAWFFAIFAVAFSMLYFAYYPHQLITVPSAGANHFDDVAYGISVHSWWGEISITVCLNLFAGLFGWLAALSFESALAWGEQANNEAKAAKEMAAYKDAAEKALDQFIQEITQSIVALENGRVSLLQQRALADPLHNIVIFLNNEIKKLAALRARHMGQVGLEGIGRELHQLALELNQAFAALDQGYLHLLQELPATNPLHSIVIVFNNHLKKLLTLYKQSYSVERTEMQRLLELLIRVKNQTTPVKFLDPGPGHFSSSCQEVNSLAREVYLLCLTSQLPDKRQKNSPISDQNLSRPNQLP